MYTHRQQLFLDHVAQTSEFPLLLEIERAEGIYMYSPEGKQYIDLISGIGVSNVGHRHPKVIAAIQAQLEKHMHLMVYGEFVQSSQVLLADALAKTLPEPLESVYFTNSGAEAIEGAMKLAKRYTGRHEIVSCFHSYHGSTQGALSLSSAESFKQAYRPLLPGIDHIQYNNLADLTKITHKTAAVVIETIQGEAGIRIADHTYFTSLRQRCTETGTLLILDEIQTGFGRTGTFWGFEHYTIIPDIVVCAKGMGGGMPIGAFISSKEIMFALANNPILGHLTTFGGHPVSCAAALATLQVIQQENLLEGITRKEQLFKQLLIHPKIRSIRSKGLMIAVEFESFEVLKPIIDKAIQNGVITDWFLHCDNSMRIAPPLIITEEQIEQACAIIVECVSY
ncbi:aspartate aminotransferase family protein [Cytophagaceae bacterium DM2B3-1]|uniref:Aspartate aminotransferase family protein n=1 Tax=Xanthocytophaga flava TaxID=3048013 RepID=A0ABT7CJM6_9BACT|nr:aspartate aminotransferase family protein [Xanthocytophaga flavus]MDJ1493205.1 aspartate aminotransferase family protein [Xanthocytophaga flavus]